MNPSCDKDVVTPSFPEDKPMDAASEECSKPNIDTSRDESTSEIFKIEITGFPFTWVVEYNEIKTFLTNKLNLKPNRIKVTKRFPQSVFATFGCEEERAEAINIISGSEWKDHKLTAQAVKTSSDEDVVPGIGTPSAPEVKTFDEGGGDVCEKPEDAATEEGFHPGFHMQDDDFDSEDFKIEMEGFPPDLIVENIQVKTFLKKKLNLKAKKIKVTKNVPQSVFVAFRCEAHRDLAVNRITGRFWKGYRLSAKKMDPPLNKRKADFGNDSEDVRKPKLGKWSKEDESTDFNTDNQTEIPVSLILKNLRTPLWELPYGQQVREKQEEMLRFMSKLTQNLIFVNPHFLPANQPRGAKDKDLCCPLEPIISSPIITGYLNRTEFSVGLHPETEQPTVGYRISNNKNRSKCVAEPTLCSNVPDIMQKCAEVFQTYIRASPLPVYNQENYQGFWRRLSVRTSLKEHLLLIVVLHPQNLTEEEITAEKYKLQDYFANSAVKVTSLFLQRFARTEKEEPPLEHICGTTFMEEELLGMTFRISPTASFQMNTLAAERLYTVVRGFATLTNETTVVDLCCGTGAIGISLAKHVRKLIGVEVCQAAVEDARRNAQANGIENAEFVCGKVEKVIYQVFKTAAEDDVVAILDPARSLNKETIRAIRGMARLRQLVYLSSSPSCALENFVDLCRAASKNYRGSPFLPVRAVAVDLFPQTSQCELVVLFERK